MWGNCEKVKMTSFKRPNPNMALKISWLLTLNAFLILLLQELETNQRKKKKKSLFQCERYKA